MSTTSSRITKIGGLSWLSKHLSCVKRSHLLASPVKQIFYGLSCFYKIGAIQSPSLRSEVFHSNYTVERGGIFVPVMSFCGIYLVTCTVFDIKHVFGFDEYHVI